jgi:hypothetical protein
MKKNVLYAKADEHLEGGGYMFITPTIPEVENVDSYVERGCYYFGQINT